MPTTHLASVREKKKTRAKEGKKTHDQDEPEIYAFSDKIMGYFPGFLWRCSFFPILRGTGATQTRFVYRKKRNEK